jgi:hypothetical protein
LSNILNLLYVFLAALVALPIVELILLEARRARALRAFGAARGRRALAIVQREETVALLGLPLFRYVTVPSADEVGRSLARLSDAAPLDLVVHLPRAAPLDVNQVARALVGRRGPVTLIVPDCALTGGHTLARAADELLADGRAGFAQDAEEAVGPRELGSVLVHAPSDGADAASHALAAQTPAADVPATHTALPAGLGGVLDLYARPCRRRGRRGPYAVAGRRRI